MKRTKESLLLIVAMLLFYGNVMAQEGRKLVVNGDFEGSDFSSFFYKNSDEIQKVTANDIYENGNHCLKIVSLANAENTWDSQLFIKLPEGVELLPGTKVKFSMSVKASRNTKITTQGHDNPGEYLCWGVFGDIDVSSDWKNVSGTFSIPKNDAFNAVTSGNVKTIAFDLNYDLEHSIDFYFDEISIILSDSDVPCDTDGNKLAIYGTEYIVNGNFEGSDYRTFIYKDSNGMREINANDIIVDEEGNHYLKVVSQANAENIYDTQLFITLPEGVTLPPGTYVKFSMRYKASQNTYLPIEGHENPGEYLCPVFNAGDNVSEEWERYYDYYNWTFSIPNNEEDAVTSGEVRTIAFNLNYDQEHSIEFYFDDFTLVVYKPFEPDNNTPSVPRPIVIEEFSGTGCGWAPRSIVALDRVKEVYGDDITYISIHQGEQDPMCYYNKYPYYPIFTPSIYVNRKNVENSRNSDYKKPIDALKAIEEERVKRSPALVELSAAWSDESKSSIWFDATTTYLTKWRDLRLEMLLVEDGKKGSGDEWGQLNYYSGMIIDDPDLQPYTALPSVISDMEYNNVAVGMSYGERKDGQWGYDYSNGLDVNNPQDFIHEYDISSNKLIQDKDKLSVLCLLCDEVTDDLVNVAKCKISDAVIKAQNYSREYGEANPAFNYTVNGIKIGGKPEVTCEAKVSSPVGAYPIAVGKGGITNNNVTYIDGTLTITKAPLTITAKNYTIKQGEGLPEFVFNYEGFKNDDTESVLTTKPKVTCQATKDSEPGQYWIKVSGAEAQNYEISYVAGILTIESSGVEESIKISSARQVAYYSENNLDFTRKTDLKAYVATGYDKANGTIWLTRVKQVPANTGFLLMGDEGKYSIPTVGGVSDSYYKNMFKGTINGTTIYTTDGDYTNYYLSNGDYGIGFYKVNGSVALKHNRAYLPIPTDIPANGGEGDTEVIKVGSALQVPYFTSKDLDFSTMDAQGVKAYTATGYNYGTGTIWLTRVKKVPAQTGVLVMVGEAGEYSVPTASVASVYENMFSGSEAAQTIYDTETIDGVNYVNYYLSKGDYGVGFYKAKADGVSMGANRCYLQVPYRASASGARGESRNIAPIWCNMILSEEGDDVIAIPVYGSADGDNDGTTNVQSSMFNDQSSDVYYNLQGQRVDKPGKGIFIKNGKKVLIK